MRTNDYSTAHQLTQGKILIILNAHKNAEKLDHSDIPKWKCKWGNYSEKEFGSFLYLPYNLAGAQLGIYPGEMTTYAHTKTCTQILLTALFIIGLIGNDINVLQKVKR